MRIVLASKSPRRRELLSLITKEFEVIVSNSDEFVNEALSPEEKVIDIANQKAKDVFAPLEGDVLVIGSDTVVVTEEDVILGKPKDHDDAVKILKSLSNKAHRVMTAVALICRKNGKIEEKSFCDITSVYVKKLTDCEIEKWLSTGNAWDKAGAYAMQQEFAVHIDKIEGNYATVVGFPVHRVYNEMKAMGII